MTTAIETRIVTKTEHQIPGALLQKKVQITVVGCGGTGSAIAAGLPYLHQAMVGLGHPYGLDVILVDGDRISRTNCVRQPFSESEIGLHKATVLATRINLFWGLGWKGVPHFVDESWGHETDILIGCVDSRAARNVVHASGSVKEAADEINHWFKPAELMKYKTISEKMLYDVNLDGILE